MNLVPSVPRRAVLAAAGLAAVASGAAQARTGRAGPSGAPKGYAEAWARATAGFDADLKADGVVGGSLYFLQGGRTLGAEHYGFADLESGRRVDERTVYHWASNTKTFTAIALMQLRDQGLVSLDDPVVRYVPALRAVHDPFGRIDEINLRHLLTHSGGFRGSTFPWGGDKPWHPHEPKAWSTVEAMMPYTEIEFRPGSRFSYSNLGFSLVGRVIELVTGQHIDSYIDKNILKPLDMTESYFDLTPYFLLKHRSNNYYIVDGEPRANGLEVDTGATLANGGLNAPVPDFARYANFLLGVNDNGAYGAVLSRRTLEEMWRPQLPAGGGAEPIAIGLGFFVVDHKLPNGRTTRFCGHGGDQLAFHTSFQFNPEAGCAYLAAGNTVQRGKEAAWPVHVRDAMYQTIVPLFLDRARTGAAK